MKNISRWADPLPTLSALGLTLLMSSCTQILGYSTPTLGSDAGEGLKSSDATSDNSTPADTDAPTSSTGDVADSAHDRGGADTSLADAKLDGNTSEADASFNRDVEHEAGASEDSTVADDASTPDAQEQACNTAEQCELPACRDAGGLCQSLVWISGRVTRFDLASPTVVANARINLANESSNRSDTTTSAEGLFRVSGIPVGSAIDLSIYWNDGQSPTFVSTSRASLPLGTVGALPLDVPYVPFTWLIRTATQCGLYASETEAQADLGFFAQHSHVVGTLVDAAGNPVSGVPNSAIRVTLRSGTNAYVNRHGQVTTSTQPKTTVCFLDRETTTGVFETNPTAKASTSSGRFVMFGLRSVPAGQSSSSLGAGVASVEAAGFAREVVAVQSGNAGVVRLVPGTSEPQPTDGGVGPNFETDVYPIFKSPQYSCSLCHAKPGDGGAAAPGWAGSKERGPELRRLAFDGTAEDVYQNLLAGTQVGCEQYPDTLEQGDSARVCLARPEQSLLLRLPLANKPKDEPNHVGALRDTSDPAYQTIYQWIVAGARR